MMSSRMSKRMNKRTLARAWLFAIPCGWLTAIAVLAFIDATAAEGLAVVFALIAGAIATGLAINTLL
jgi:hypothetical protein